jgi:hypothetical protein
MSMWFELDRAYNISLVFAIVEVSGERVGSCNNSWALFASQDIGAITRETYRLPISDSIKCSAVESIRFHLDAPRLSSFMEVSTPHPRGVSLTLDALDVLPQTLNLTSFGRLQIHLPITLEVGVQDLNPQLFTPIGSEPTSPQTSQTSSLSPPKKIITILCIFLVLLLHLKRIQ